MRIAINCRSCANKGGIGRYSRALIRELINRFDDHHFLLFSPPETDFAFIDKKPNWESMPVSGSSNRPLWETFNLTNAVNKSEPDIFHNPDYTVPSGIKAPSTVTVHVQVLSNWCKPEGSNSLQPADSSKRQKSKTDHG
jgi:hypothetical protein